MDIRDVWNRLGQVRELAFTAESHSVTKTGWNGTGQGTVVVELVDRTTTIFHESGTWLPEGGRELKFSNTFRWILNLNPEYLQLEHLRLGLQNPVYLFHLVLTTDDTLEAAEPHVCRDDLYTARMNFDSNIIKLDWKVTGPGIDERISYIYC